MADTKIQSTPPPSVDVPPVDGEVMPPAEGEVAPAVVTAEASVPETGADTLEYQAMWDLAQQSATSGTSSTIPPATTSTSDTSEYQQAANEETSWFDSVTKEAAGDETKLAKALPLTQPPVEQAVAMGQALEESSFGDADEGEGEEIYDRALTQKYVLDTLASKMEALAKTLPPGELQDQFNAQAGLLKKQAGSLGKQLTAFEQRQADAKTMAEKAKYEKLIKSAAPQDLTPEQEAALAKNGGKAMKAGDLAQAAAARSTGAPAKAATPQAAKDASTADQAKASADQPTEGTPTEGSEKTSVTEKAVSDAQSPVVTDEQVRLAEVAVRADPKASQRAEEAKKGREERDLKIKLARNEFSTAKAELKEIKGEAAQRAGQKRLMALGERKRQTEQRALGDLLGGTSQTGGAVVGLVFFDGAVADAAQAGLEAELHGVAGKNTAASFSGKREDVDEGMAKYNPKSTGFDTQFPMGEREQMKGVPGVMAMWVPWSERPTTAAQLKRQQRELNMGVA